MLKLVIPDREVWDQKTEEFINIKGQTICLEHSLISLSKWESKWNKPFLVDKDKTEEEITSYIECMAINPVSDPRIFNCLTNGERDRVANYISAPMTATWFSDDENKPKSREIITSEVIYYWMISCNIPFECEKWHLNRLITLIRVCEAKNAPPKKMGKQALYSRNRALNESRRKALNSKG